VEGRFQRDHGPGPFRRVEHEATGTIRHQIPQPQALRGLRWRLVRVLDPPDCGAINKISLVIEPAGIVQRRPLPLGPEAVMPRH